MLFLLVIYQHYIAQCRRKRVRFTTSSKNELIKSIRKLSMESQQDTTSTYLGNHTPVGT